MHRYIIDDKTTMNLFFYTINTDRRFVLTIDHYKLNIEFFCTYRKNFMISTKLIQAVSINNVTLHAVI